MIIQSVSTVQDMVNHRVRVTFYKTVEDPATHKTTLEVVSFIYNNKADIQPTKIKGVNVDIQA